GVLPHRVRVLVSVGPGEAQGGREVGVEAGRIVSLDHFGASADYQPLYREFELTPEAVARAARESVAAARGDAPPAHDLPDEPHGEIPTGDAAEGGARSTDPARHH